MRRRQPGAVEPIRQRGRGATLYAGAAGHAVAAAQVGAGIGQQLHALPSAQLMPDILALQIAAQLHAALAADATAGIKADQRMAEVRACGRFGCWRHAVGTQGLVQGFVRVLGQIVRTAMLRQTLQPLAPVAAQRRAVAAQDHALAQLQRAAVHGFVLAFQFNGTQPAPGRCGQARVMAERGRRQLQALQQLQRAAAGRGRAGLPIHPNRDWIHACSCVADRSVGASPMLRQPALG